MAECSRFPQGILMTGSLLVARPVGCLILDSITLGLWRSTNAAVATYALVGAGTAGTVPDGSAITWGTGLDVTATANGTDLVWARGAGAGDVTYADSLLLQFGTGEDVVFNPNGTDLLIQQGAGAGAFRFQDSLVVSFGTGNDVILTPNGTDLLVSGAGATRYQDSAVVSFGTGVDVTLTPNGTDLLIAQGAGAGAWRFQDTIVTSWGAGNDLIFTPNGTDVLVTGAGALRFQDSYVTSYGTGNDLIVTPDGTNVVFTGAGLGLWSDSVFAIGDNADTTKRLRFEASGITAGQTRVITAADRAVSLQTNIANDSIADPGSGAAIPVTSSGCVSLALAGAGETNTLAIPTVVGQELHITVASFVAMATRAITVAASFNAAGNTVITLDAAADTILLRAANVGGALRWRVVYNDGAALS